MLRIYLEISKQDYDNYEIISVKIRSLLQKQALLGAAGDGVKEKMLLVMSYDNVFVMLLYHRVHCFGRIRLSTEGRSESFLGWDQKRKLLHSSLAAKLVGISHVQHLFRTHF